MNGRDIDGGQVDRCDHSVGVHGRDQGHRGSAPRTGTIVEQAARGLVATGHQAAQPGARDERQVPGQHRQAELGEAKREVDAHVQDRHAEDDQGPEHAHPDQDRVAQLEKQAAVGDEVQQQRIRRQPGEVEPAELARRDHAPGREPRPPGLTLQLRESGHSIDEGQVQLDQPQARDWPKSRPEVLQVLMTARASWRRRSISTRACRQRARNRSSETACPLAPVTAR